MSLQHCVCHRVLTGEANPYLHSTHPWEDQLDSIDEDFKDGGRWVCEPSFDTLGIIFPGNVQEEIQFSIIPGRYINTASHCNSLRLNNRALLFDSHNVIENF